jgi:hypothetical protein
VAKLQQLKLITALLLYGIPWLVLTVSAGLFILLRDAAPDGSVVFMLLIQGCALAIGSAYCALISTTPSEPVAGVGILVLNMAFSLFIVSFSQPEYGGVLRTDRIVWPDYALLTFAGLTST